MTKNDPKINGSQINQINQIKQMVNMDKMDKQIFLTGIKFRGKKQSKTPN